MKKKCTICVLLIIGLSCWLFFANAADQSNNVLPMLPIPVIPSTINNTADCTGPWYRANLTNYTSFPEPNSEECLEFNGCTWAGYFYGLDEQQTEEWVAAHNVIAVHSKDWEWLGMKTLKIRQKPYEITATVYDLCSDSDCNGCCTANLGGDGYLIDIEFYTMERFGSGEGIVEFQVCNSN